MTGWSSCHRSSARGEGVGEAARGEGTGEAAHGDAERSFLAGRTGDAGDASLAGRRVGLSPLALPPLTATSGSLRRLAARALARSSESELVSESLPLLLLPEDASEPLEEEELLELDESLPLLLVSLPDEESSLLDEEDESSLDELSDEEGERRRFFFFLSAAAAAAACLSCRALSSGGSSLGSRNRGRTLGLSSCCVLVGRAW